MKQFKLIVQDQNLNPTNWSPQNFMVWKSAIESLKIKKIKSELCLELQLFYFSCGKGEFINWNKPQT